MTALAALEVTDSELGSLAGVSARRIRQLAENGTLARTGQNKYPLGESVRALLEDAAGSGSELQRQRTRKVRADADKAELELEKLRGTLVSRETVVRVQSERYTIIRVGMMNIPQRVVTMLLGETDEAVFKQKLRQEIILALTAAAEAAIEINDDEEPINDEL